jgi:excisionase family DNA binding protein
MDKEKSERSVMSITEAGRRLDISRDAAYAAARRGDIPTLRIGRLLKVPRVRFERMLAGEDK